jgi:hypothetical protein
MQRTGDVSTRGVFDSKRVDTSIFAVSLCINPSLLLYGLYASYPIPFLPLYGFFLRSCVLQGLCGWSGVCLEVSDDNTQEFEYQTTADDE